MDTLSYFPVEMESFDDDFFQQQSIYDGYGYESIPRSGHSFESLRQSLDQPVEEDDAIASIPFLFDEIPYPSYNSMIEQPQMSNMQIPPMQGFEYIDFGESTYAPEMPLSNTTSTEIYPPNSEGLEADDYGLSYHRTVSASSASQEPSPLEEKRSPTKSKRAKTKAWRSGSSTMSDTSSPAAFDTRRRFSAAGNVSATTTRPAKKSRGPPKSLLAVFDSNTEPTIKRNSRKAFSEEGKRKVEAVRSVGACVQCRFRKRTVSISSPRYQLYGCSRQTSAEPVGLVTPVFGELEIMPLLPVYACESLLSRTYPSLNVSCCRSH